jgi:hypothetical protein
MDYKDTLNLPKTAFPMKANLAQAEPKMLAWWDQVGIYKRLREAAADLNFEEAARLRDEVKRLRATELAVVDDPTAKQRTVQGKAGAYAGTKKYGDAANLPVSAMKRKTVSSALKASGGGSGSSTRGRSI